MPRERFALLQIQVMEKAKNKDQDNRQPAQRERRNGRSRLSQRHPANSPLDLFNEEGTKPPRIPDQEIAFLQHAFAVGADKSLPERLRFFMAHGATKPHLTLAELALFADVTSGVRAGQLWVEGRQGLWQNLSPEDQQRYPLALFQRHRAKGVPISSEKKTRLIEANKGKPLSAKRIAHLERLHASLKNKPFTREHRAALKEAKRKYWENRKREQTEQSQPTQVYPTHQK